jgi:protease I
MRKTIYLLIICIIVFGCGHKTSSSSAPKVNTDKDAAFITAESLRLINDTTKIKRLVMVVAPRAFRDEEFRVPYLLLTQVGHQVSVASRDTALAYGMLGTVLKPQMTIKDIDTLSFDGIILVGGTGAAIYWDDITIHQLVKYYARTPHKIVAAICLAPVTLARAGIIAGIKATVFEDKTTVNELKSNGAQYEKTDVVVSGNIVTASGPQASEKFARAIVRLVSGY